MGLETVELLMSIEEEFGIHIDDDVATSMTTPEEVANYVYSRVRKSEKDPCLSQKGFYKLRKIISETFNINRNKIKPDTELRELLGDNIKRDWKLLKLSIDVKDFPRLQRNNALIYGSILILPFIVISPLLVNCASFELILISFLFISILLNGITYKMSNTIPDKYKCVSSLIPYVECSNNTILDKEVIIERIIEITSDQLGIPVDQINKDSHFVQELGAD